jgi:hypothetical protein
MESILTKNLILSFFIWWYFEFPKQLFILARLALKRIFSSLSISQVLRTFFSPWKRIVTFKANDSIQENLRSLEDNAISRFVGMGVRTLMLTFAFLVLVFYLITILVIATLWVIMPFLPFILIIYSFKFL